MGDWNITIRGTGAHHNTDYPKDANRMAGRFVEQLSAAGHQVRAASFTHGGEEAFVGGTHPAWSDPSGRAKPTVETDSAIIVRDAGRRAFDAYREKRGGKNHDGTPTPTWDELTDGVREGWIAAAAAVLGA